MFKKLWFSIFGQSKLKQELLDALKKNLKLEKRLQQQQFTLLTLPTQDTMPQYLSSLENIYNNKWMQVFFTLRERELVAKFKDGGDAEVLRGAFLAIQDIRSSLEDAAQKSIELRSQNEI